MTNAYRDENSVPTLIGALDTDGSTVARVEGNAFSHALKVNDGTTGSDFGPKNALKDENGVSTLIAVSSADGITPVVVYTDANGRLLVDSS